MAGLLDRERTIAKPGFNRWLVPPPALAVHLSIGMAYGFSVFWLPLSKAIGVSQPVPCPEDMSVFAQLVTTTCDWKISMLGWMYTLFFVFLGSINTARPFDPISGNAVPHQKSQYPNKPAQYPGRLCKKEFISNT